MLQPVLIVFFQVDSSKIDAASELNLYKLITKMIKPDYLPDAL